MIKFALKCQQQHIFDAWFAGSDAFEKQRSAGLLSCPICNSNQVDKALMAPAVTGTDRHDSPERDAGTLEVAAHQELPPEALEIARRIKKHVTENAENVGDKFAEEARKIHFEEVERRGIYGKATKEEVVDLIDEGIEFHPLPALPEENN